MKRDCKESQQLIIEALLQICLALGERNAQLATQNRKLANELHREIDYSDRLQKKIDNLNKGIRNEQRRNRKYRQAEKRAHA
jgi:pantothenate synthetase